MWHIPRIARPCFPPYDGVWGKCDRAAPPSKKTIICYSYWFIFLFLYVFGWLWSQRLERSWHETPRPRPSLQNRDLKILIPRPVSRTLNKWFFLLYICFRLTRKSFFVDKKALQNWRFPGSSSQVSTFTYRKMKSNLVHLTFLHEDLKHCSPSVKESAVIHEINETNETL